MRVSEQLSRMRARKGHKGHHHYETEKWDNRSNHAKRKDLFMQKCKTGIKIVVNKKHLHCY